MPLRLEGGRDGPEIPGPGCPSTSVPGPCPNLMASGRITEGAAGMPGTPALEEEATAPDGIPGNKMTSLNLATIFGPNLLHKQKTTDKEFTVQSSARAEESTAIIAVVQKMIENYEMLFMVPADLQNEVLISLLETDPDVVDYLLRRKASQSSNPEMLQSEGLFSMGGRHSSTDSNRASSGDVSPYDNNSPVLSERSLLAMQEDTALGSERLFKVPEQCMLVSNSQPKSRENSPGSWLGKGSYGDIYESSSLRPGQCSLSQGNLSLPSPQWPESTTELDNTKQIIRRSHTTAALPECHSHPPLSRVCSTPQIEGGRKSSCQSNSERHFSTSSTEHFVECDSDATCLHSTAKTWCQRPGEIIRKDRPPPPPYPETAKQSSALSLWPAVSSAEHPSWRLQRPEIHSGTVGEGKAVTEVPEQCALLEEQQQDNTGTKTSSLDSKLNSKFLTEPDWHDWQRDRWQIWEILSTDNPDALPETLV
uniref:Uncharacterized protein n=1 Tax=Sphaerodactylus townsendi TaxID=933632 RepID=A0ACB8FIM9_9SAUR